MIRATIILAVIGSALSFSTLSARSARVSVALNAKSQSVPFLEQPAALTGDRVHRDRNETWSIPPTSCSFHLTYCSLLLIRQASRWCWIWSSRFHRSMGRCTSSATNDLLSYCSKCASDLVLMLFCCYTICVIFATTERLESADSSRQLVGGKWENTYHHCWVDERSWAQARPHFYACSIGLGCRRCRCTHARSWIRVNQELIRSSRRLRCKRLNDVSKRRVWSSFTLGWLNYLSDKISLSLAYPITLLTLYIIYYASVLLLLCGLLELTSGAAIFDQAKGSGRASGDFSFDPLGLGKDAKKKERYAVSEIKNGRLAMLAISGILTQQAAFPDQAFPFF